MMAICAVILSSACLAAAQNFEVRVKISADSPNIIQMSGSLPEASKLNWSFLKSFAATDDLGARISNLQLFDEQNQPVAAKKLSDGEYLADAPAVNFQYQVAVEPPSKMMAKPRLSSTVAGEQGILMLDDLLPQISADNQPFAARIKIELPEDWRIYSSEQATGDGIYEVKNVGKAIFAVGVDWRETKTANVNLIISGEWHFTDTEAAQMGGEIGDYYKNLFGEMPFEKANIILARLPKETKFGRWKAETRGTTSMVFSADQPFKARSIQFLHEQLRHELFHLWIPNNLNLTGNYDWFYEGFTVYQALRMGLKTNQIRFEDFLATLAEAYNLDELQMNKVSLVESSKNRWSGVTPQIYARGMLVAFLCDTAILKGNRGSRSVENIFQDVYRAHRFPNEAADGNAAVLSVLRKYKSLQPIIEKYIEGAEKIDWAGDLNAAGIEATVENSIVKLSVKTKPNRGQKDLLNELGYNNWRKISQESK